MQIRQRWLWAVGLLCLSNVGRAEIKIGGELRVRPEYRDNQDFNKNTQDTLSFVGSRLRVTGQGDLSDRVAVKFTFQDTRLWGEEANAAGLTDVAGSTTTGAVEKVDIHEAYMDLKSFPWESFALRVGRQEFVYGDQRLVGNFGWSHQGRAFDAFRLKWKGTDAWADVWTAKRKENNGSTAGSAAQDRDFAGAYFSSTKGLPGATWDLYVLNDREGDVVGAADPKNITTVGARVAGKAHRIDYTLEAPFQFGRAGRVVGTEQVDVQANALAAKLGHTCGGDRQIRLGVEYDYASGDSNTSDTKAKTFNNLYPTNHIHYGLMDQQAWMNMQALNLSLSGKPRPSSTAVLSFWDFRLAKKADGWYKADGTATGIRAANALNTKSALGQEIDVLWKQAVAPELNWEIGLGHFMPGTFVKSQVADEGAQTWGYVQLTATF